MAPAALAVRATLFARLRPGMEFPRDCHHPEHLTRFYWIGREVIVTCRDHARPGHYLGRVVRHEAATWEDVREAEGTVARRCLTPPRFVVRVR